MRKRVRVHTVLDSIVVTALCIMLASDCENREDGPGMHDEASAKAVRQPTNLFTATRKFGSENLVQNSSNL